MNRDMSYWRLKSLTALVLGLLHGAMERSPWWRSVYHTTQHRLEQPSVLLFIGRVETSCEAEDKLRRILTRLARIRWFTVLGHSNV